MDFEQGAVALVTGAGSGIGRAAAIAFARAGVRVGAADVDAEAVKQVVQSLGGDAVAIEGDVSRADQVSAMVARVVDRFGRLDFAFNNAGIEGTSSPLEEGREEGWDRVVDVNLKGVWLCMREELRAMKAAGRGAIVNCASIAGLVGFSDLAPYVASKHGVIGLTRSAALETASSGIRVNAVCPGVIRTPMVERYTGGDPSREAELTSSAPMGRMGRPEEIADAVLWLCSSGASYVTGAVLPVDGGWVTR